MSLKAWARLFWYSVFSRCGSPTSLFLRLLARTLYCSFTLDCSKTRNNGWASSVLSMNKSQKRRPFSVVNGFRVAHILLLAIKGSYVINCLGNIAIACFATMRYIVNQHVITQSVRERISGIFRLFFIRFMSNCPSKRCIQLLEYWTLISESAIRKRNSNFCGDYNDHLHFIDIFISTIGVKVRVFQKCIPSI